MQLSGFLKLLDYQIIAALINVVVAWKWGDWRNWKLYYPTMLFMALGSFTYSLLTYNFPLWAFESPLLKTTGSNLLFTFIGFPADVLLYLTYFPKTLSKQIIYVLAWVAYFMLIEWLSYRLGFISYHSGWTIWWSLLFNCIMFPLIWLHFKRPLWALSFSFVVAVFFLTYFKIPFSSMK